ncbi:MAG TPA: class I SAM-dependent methyltransferase [Vicinamibacterales bacterium]|nr:class I SAM-dependent methyltransferase [Vicinamibacterales bacterium]
MSQSRRDLRPTEAVARCPCCECDRLKLFERFPHYGIPLEYQICRHCGLVFMSPRLSELQLAGFYRSGYRPLVGPSPESKAKNQVEQRQRAEHLVTILKAHGHGPRSHLDIGCSLGELLLQVQDAFGCATSVGVEPGEDHRGNVPSTRIRVVAALEEVRPPEGGFELVTLSHVLEHLRDPLQYLHTVRRHYLAPDGVLLIEVPNLMGHLSFELAHQYCFSRKTLRDLVRRAGFRVSAITLHSFPRGRIGGDRYITLVATPIPAADVAPARIAYVPWWVVKLQRVRAMDARPWPVLAARGLRRALGVRTLAAGSDSRDAARNGGAQ